MVCIGKIPSKNRLKILLQPVIFQKHADRGLFQGISYRGYPRNCLQLHFQATLPYKNQLVKINSGTRNYTTVLIGLTPKLVKKLENLAKKQGKSQSPVLRQILDSYFKDIEKNGLPYEPLRKFSPIGLKFLPRTISKEQDAKLRELCEKTGRKISELVREAVERFV